MREIKLIRADRPEIVRAVPLWEAMTKEKWPEHTPNSAWWMTETFSLHRTGMYHLVIAKENGDYIGFIDGLISREPATGTMTSICRCLYVIPRMRHKGIALMLADELEKIAAERQVASVNILCDPGDQAMWERKGFNLQSLVMRRDN